MATIVHKAGTALATGATASGISGAYTQTSGESSGGELKLIFDETGADLAAYVTDPHKEYTFEAVLAASAADHDIGDIVTGPGEQSCLVTKWEVSESNEDVKKVSIGLRPTSLSAPAQSSSSGGGGGGEE